MKKFITRTYNDFHINRDHGTITKLSENPKLGDEIGYYKLIGLYPSLRKFFPRIFESGVADKSNYLQLEYIDYPNLAEIMMYQNFDGVKWSKIVHQLLFILKAFGERKTESDRYDTAKEKMYIEKTLIEYQKFSESDEEFSKLTSHKFLIINGETYRNFAEIQTEIVDLIRRMLCTKEPMTVVHGDFCFGNIIGSVNLKKDIASLKLIDPRGSWGPVGVFGDPKYDIAKLKHSYDGCYEYLTNDLFQIVHEGNNFNLSFSNSNNIQIAKVFETDLLQKLEADPVIYDLIQGLIFIGMCARHYDSKPRQFAMYITGVRLLNHVIEKTYVKR